MLNGKVWIAFVVICYMAALSAKADTVISEIAQYAKDPASKVISDFQNAGGQLIDQGQAAGNGMITHAGMELDAASRNAVIGMGADLDKQVGNLTQGEQAVILSLQRLQDQGKKLTDGAYNLKDTTVVDLTSWEHNWIFAHTPDFFVQSIRGTALLPQPGDYQVSLIALGLGEASDSKAEITATLNDKAFQFASVDQTSQRGQAILTLPNAAIAPLFAPDKLALANLKITVKLSRKKIFGWKTHSYDFPVKLLLYPARIATVNVTMTAPDYDWVSIGDTPSQVVLSPDKNGCKYCDPSCTAKNSVDTVVPGVHTPLAVGDERIISATQSCTPNNLCQYVSRQNIAVIDNGARARMTWETCSGPASFQLHGATQQWQLVGSKTTSEKVALAIDDPQVVQLPDGVTLIVVEVTSFTKQHYKLILPQNDPHSIISAQRQPATANLVISAVPPS